MAAPAPTLRARLLALAERRLPALTRLRRAEPLPIRLDRRRIYVLPTGFGMALCVLLFVMLIGALNYGNNPALLLTCLFGAACGTSLFLGFRALNGVRLVHVHAAEAHEGGPLALQLVFDAGARARPSLRLRRDASEIAFALPAGGHATVTLSLVAPRRGWFRPGRIRLATEYPLGLFDIWSWLHPDIAILVLPAPEPDAPPLPGGDGAQGEFARGGASEEHAGLREYRPGDPSRLIAWKASTRHEHLLARDVEARAGETLRLDIAALRGLDHEARVRRLTAWVLAAESERRAYALDTGIETFGPSLGAAHRAACLRALALLPRADGSTT